MAEKLKIISLGGLNEIGKNLTVYEYGGDIIVVDVGMGFPDDDMYGIDVVIPDFSYLIKNQDKIRGIFLTHGHEDHIGSIPYCMQQVRCPIHATAMAKALHYRVRAVTLDGQLIIFPPDLGTVVPLALDLLRGDPRGFLLQLTSSHGNSIS